MPGLGEHKLSGIVGVKRPKVDSYEGKTPAIADKEDGSTVRSVGELGPVLVRFTAPRATSIWTRYRHGVTFGGAIESHAKKEAGVLCWRLA